MKTSAMIHMTPWNRRTATGDVDGASAGEM